MNWDGALGSGKSLAWQVIVLAVAALVCSPLFIIASSWTEGLDWELWRHLVDRLLAEYVLNSIGIALATTSCSLFLGTFFAYLVTSFRCFGHNLITLVLMLPMAIPAYVLAFVWSYLLEDLVRFRGFWASVFTLSSALYPYVFYLVRNALMKLDQHQVDAAACIGMGRLRIFWSICMPGIRRALAAGGLLVCMECLADFGTVSILGVDTLTTAIYKSWFGFQSLTTAAQIASILVGFSLLIFVLEGWTKGITDDRSQVSLYRAIELNNGGKALVSGILYSCSLALGLVPLMGLLYLSFLGVLKGLNGDFLLVVQHSFEVSAIAALIIVSVVLMLSEIDRFVRKPSIGIGISLSKVGYAFPGTVLAIGIYIPLIKMDQFLSDVFWQDETLHLTGGIAIIVIGLSIRFLAVGQSSVQPMLRAIGRSIDEAAFSLGADVRRVVIDCHLPLMRSALGTAFVLAFIDCLKEMPLTLMTRPFGYDTLAVKVYEFTSEGQWEWAAVPSLIIVSSAMLALWFIRLKRAIV